MDAIQIAIAAAAMTFAKTNAGTVGDSSSTPALFASEPSRQDLNPFNDRQVIAGTGHSAALRD